MTRFTVDMQAFANFSQNVTTAQEFSLRRCCSYSAHHDMGDGEQSLPVAIFLCGITFYFAMLKNFTVIFCA